VTIGKGGCLVQGQESQAVDVREAARHRVSVTKGGEEKGAS
jgi:hypothetical protein